MMDDVSLAQTLQSLAAQLATFLALLLVASLLHQAARWQRSLGVARQLAGLPRGLAAPALGVMLVAEATAAGFLILPGYRSLGALMAALIWSLYLGLIVRAIVQDRRDVDCGCSFGPTARPLGRFHVARNGLLTGCALLLSALCARYGAVALHASQLLAGLALLTLYGAVDQVMALQPLRSGETA